METLLDILQAAGIGAAVGIRPYLPALLVGALAAGDLGVDFDGTGWAFLEAPWFLFVMGIAFFVMLMTNVIMNVAAIAISLPVALVIAPYLGVAPEVILFASLATAGMPFLLLVGAAPNAIAYESGQFTAGEFFTYGTLASIMLMVVVALAVFFLWPLMGMPVGG